MSYYQQNRYAKPQKPQLPQAQWLNGAAPGLNVVLRAHSAQLDAIAGQLVKDAQTLTCIPWQRGQDSRGLPDDVLTVQLNNGRSRAFVVGKAFDKHLTVLAPEVVSATTPPVAVEILAWLHAEFARNGKGLVAVIESRAHAECLMGAGACPVFWQCPDGRLVPVPSAGLQPAMAALQGMAWKRPADVAPAVVPPAPVEVVLPWQGHGVASREIH